MVPTALGSRLSATVLAPARLTASAVHGLRRHRDIRSLTSAGTEPDTPGAPPPPPDVRQVASMAQLAVTEDEMADWEPKIRDIVGWFDQLREVELGGVAPRVRAGEGANRLRPDVAREYGDREDMMGLAPQREGRFVRVPKIATEADDAQ